MRVRAQELMRSFARYKVPLPVTNRAAGKGKKTRGALLTGARLIQKGENERPGSAMGAAARSAA